MKKGLPRVKSRGYALIYVLVFISIVSITISSIVALSLSDIRQTRKVLATDGSFQMAQSGIEDGIANLQMGDERTYTEAYFNVQKSRTAPLGIGNGYSADGKRYASSADKDLGDYYFKMDTVTNKVEAVGYFKGSKVKMKADCTGIASADSCNIYQVGF